MLSFLACLALTAVAHAQDVSSFVPNSTHAPETWTTLPTRRCLDYFIVETMINGEGPYSLLLDTGANTVALPGSADGPPEHIHIDELSSGPFVVRDIGAFRVDLAAVQKRLPDVDGILGYPVFRDVVLRIDYPDQTVSIRQGEMPTAHATHANVCPPEHLHPKIKIDVGGFLIDALIDTGHAGYVELPHALPVFEGTESRIVGTAAVVGGTEYVHAARIDADINFAGLVLTEPIAISSTQGLIGNKVLRNFAIEFDQANGRLRFELDEEAPAVRMPGIRTTGALLAPLDDKLVVRSILRNTPAAEVLQVGDRIVLIDGKDPLDDGCDESDKRDQAHVVISRDGTLRGYVIPIVTILP